MLDFRRRQPRFADLGEAAPRKAAATLAAASQRSKPHFLERITELLEEVLEQAGYVQERSEGSTRLKIRRLVRRLDLNAHDAEVWLGMLRQIRWKLLS